MINHHDHAPECEHANLKYCKTCDTPHCLDCGQQWNAYRVINNSGGSGVWPYTTAIPAAGQIWYTQPSTSDPRGNTTLPQFQSTCQHS